MKSLYILGAVILLILFFYPKITISENQIYRPVPKDSDKKSTPRIYDFYIPQLTTPQTPLSDTKFNNQTNANQLTRNTYLNGDEVDIVRDGKPSSEANYPKYIAKDTLSANTLGSNELHKSHEKEHSKPYDSFTDENVSQYPKFYTSDLKNEISNLGKFFDKKNRYVDTTSPNSSAYVDDSCYIDGNNEMTCIDNSRLQNIPPKNMRKYNQFDIEDTIGNYKIDGSKDGVMTGSFFYDSVYAASKKNETFSPFIGGSISGECSV